MNIAGLFGHWHEWTRWEEVPDTRVFTKREELGAVIETILFITQSRRCAQCGLMELTGDCA